MGGGYNSLPTLFYSECINREYRPLKQSVSGASKTTRLRFAVLNGSYPAFIHAPKKAVFRWFFIYAPSNPSRLCAPSKTPASQPGLFYLLEESLIGNNRIELVDFNLYAKAAATKLQDTASDIILKVRMRKTV